MKNNYNFFYKYKIYNDFKNIKFTLIMKFTFNFDFMIMSLILNKDSN